MATMDDVRNVCRELPGSGDIGPDQLHFDVPVKGKRKGYAWVWMERVDPRKVRIPNAAVLALRVRNNAEKELWLLTEPDKFFTEPHYNGFPAVLLRLEAVDLTDLRDLLTHAWRCVASKELLEQHR